jgi:hypothetical protein
MVLQPGQQPHGDVMSGFRDLERTGELRLGEVPRPGPAVT